MEFKNVLVEVKGQTGIITINRPKVLNALNLETVAEIEAAVKQMGANEQVRVVIITGSGDRAFVSGADIAAMKEMSVKDAAQFASTGHSCMNAIGALSKPVIAAVNGFALGGGTELAIACDIIIASENAKFGLPEVKLGLYPGFGGTQRLPRLIGNAKASELIFTGRIINAKEAFDFGIINRILPLDALMNEAMKIADEIAANSPVAVSKAKRVIRDGLAKNLPDALENERANFASLFETNDRVEGMSAFLEKRKPNFL